MSGFLIHVNLGLQPRRPCTRSELHPSSFDLIADVMAWPGLLVVLRWRDAQLREVVNTYKYLARLDCGNII